MQAQGARVVTPEAVVLDVQTAGLGSRLFARVIDGFVQLLGLFAVSVVVGVIGAASDGNASTAGLVVFLVGLTVVVFGYPIILESLFRGRTPGKSALGLRVVTRQGAPIRFRHALVRGLIGMVEVPTGFGVLAMLISSKDQRLGDMAAGTIVIRERTTGQVSAPVVWYPPAGWESYVASLDVSAMTSDEYEGARSFLLRAPQMTPEPRLNLAARLAGPLVVRWHQPVPVGMGPELWLACVASAYQRQHGVPTAPPVPAGYGPYWTPPRPAPYWTGGYGPGPPPGPSPYANGAWGPPAAPVPVSPVAVTWAAPAPTPAASGPPQASPPAGSTNGGFAPPD